MASTIKKLRGLAGLGDMGLAWLAWRNREHIVDSARFAVGAVGRWRSGEHHDVLAEARLRARIVANPRTRAATGVDVAVRDGVASLVGTASPAARDALISAAERTPGVRRVRESVAVEGRRRFGRR